MSHNLFRSGASRQNVSGDLLLGTSNISEFTGLTPQRNVILQSINSTSWSFDKLARVASVPLSWETASGSYSIGSYDYEAEDNFVFHTTRIVASSSVTLITASGDYSPITSNSFYMAYRFDGSTFDGKTIILEANLAPDCQASFVAQWCIGTGAVSSVTPIGPRSRCDGTWSDSVFGRFVGDGSTVDVCLKMISRTGSSSAIQVANGNRSRKSSIRVKVV